MARTSGQGASSPVPRSLTSPHAPVLTGLTLGGPAQARVARAAHWTDQVLSSRVPMMVSAEGERVAMLANGASRGGQNPAVDESLSRTSILFSPRTTAGPRCLNLSDPQFLPLSSSQSLHL